MNILSRFRLAALPSAVALAGGGAWAEEAAPQQANAGPIEEVVVVGRLRSSATDVVVERLEQEVVVDLLSAEDIQRVGDSDVAAALRRVPGLTLVDNQYVYVRGLGERYSSTLLNGAMVPSPDLTRNVMPLDIFPTNILDSLAVQKGYSPDMPAAFGGGNIDIRTKAIPNDFVFSIEGGSGWNFESNETTYSATSGDDDWLGDDDGTRALPAAISQGVLDYRGDFSVANIADTLQQSQPQLADSAAVIRAQALNRELGASLDGTTGIQEEDVNPDAKLQMTLGNRYFLGAQENWEVGGFLLGSYDNNFRNRQRINRSLNNPETLFAVTERTVNEVSFTGAAKAGIEWAQEHSVSASYIFLRNTEEDVNVSTFFTQDFQQSDGQRLRNYGTRWEQRELEIVQLEGEHELGDMTLETILPDAFRALEGLRFEWYYSDSTATTDIPNETNFQAEDQLDPDTLELQSTALRLSTSSGDFRFTDLEDDVQSYGYDVILPFYTSDWDFELSGGFDYSRKSREYFQTQLFVGTNDPTADLAGIPGLTADPAFTSENVLDPANSFNTEIGGIQTESYLAAQTTEGVYGKFDVTWQGTWRFSGGARWEQFQQATLPINPFEFDVNVGQSAIPDDQLANQVIQTDELYPSLSLTWIQQNRFGARDFQLRFGASRTVARPDLREISNGVFIDPLTEARVQGTPGLQPSDITNYDARAEWFFSNGDNFTVSLFYKLIEDPIETVLSAGTDNNILLTFINAEEGELYGVEFEGLKELSFLGDVAGDWASGFFLSGNLTLSDSELTVGEAALDLTNDSRRLTQHSQWVVNTQLGYDSPNAMHSATLVYNVFGPRIFSAGRNGADDAFEQPIHTVDFVYNFYPTDNITFTAKLQNLLSDEREITQDSASFGEVTIFEQLIGTTAIATLRWQL